MIGLFEDKFDILNTDDLIHIAFNDIVSLNTYYESTTILIKSINEKLNIKTNDLEKKEVYQK